MSKTIQLSGTFRFKQDSGAYSEFPVSKKNALIVPIEVYQIINEAFLKSQEEPAETPKAVDNVPHTEYAHQDSTPDGQDEGQQNTAFSPFGG